MTPTTTDPPPHPWPPSVGSVPAGIVPGDLRGARVRVNLGDASVFGTVTIRDTRPESDRAGEWFVYPDEDEWPDMDMAYGIARSCPVASLDVLLDDAVSRYALARALGVFSWLPRADGGALPDEHTGHSAALLTCEAWRRAAGMGPIVKVSPKWKRRTGVAEDWSRTGANDGRYLHVSAGGNMSGAPWDEKRTWIPRWRWHLSRFDGRFVTVAEGQEDDAESAKRAADAAALQHGHALLNPDGIRLPWPDARPEVTR